ncbi:MAG: DoxX family protein [Thermoanaerobaculia bacterium]
MAEPARQQPEAEAVSSGSRSPWALLGTLGGVALGAVFLFAAWAKAIHPDAFVEEIAGRGLTFGLGAGAVAFLALALEAGLGALLVLGVRRLWVLVPTALLVLFFLFLTGQDYYRAAAGLEVDSASCGCFGNLVQRTPAEAFWQDLALMVPALALAFVGRRGAGSRGPRAVPPVRTALGLAAAVGIVALAWKAPELPLDDWATRLRPGVEVAELCAGEGSERICFDALAPELAEGEHLVVLAELDEAFGERVERLNQYLDASYLAGSGAPGLAVFTTAGPQERQTFFWTWTPGFEPYQAPESLLAPLYRRLPRSFLVRGGEVVETWDGLPPFERWAPDMDDRIASSSGESR